MSKQSPLSDRLGRVLTTPVNGVLGLVDELLSASRETDVRLDWQAGHCHVSILNVGPSDQIDVPMQKSVIRAALARIAALCNERIPNSVSPYGGLGEVMIDADPTKMIRVKFVNTPEEQSLELAPVRREGHSIAAQPVNAETGTVDVTMKV